jgi:NAD(P) transhydrogenase subunit alpha
MKLFLPRETAPGERRVSMVPDAARKLVELGAELEFEQGLGEAVNSPDDAYTAVGATVSPDPGASIRSADMILRLRPPGDSEIESFKEGAILVSYLDPFADLQRIQRLADAKVSAICMEMIPRTTIAQKMDALSSQANLAGYVAVLLAVNKLDKIVPMMMTPAGTLPPARVFVIGAGVAGLQAIATAKRLGARVEAFDTRPVVEEQVQSLGARFLKVDLGDTGQTEGGYAKQLTEEQLGKQRDAMAKACSQADIVITTAQVFGRPAPRILTADMVKGMHPGSIVVDMAVETGGNVEGSVPDMDVDVNGVTIVGATNLAGHVPLHASDMYAANLANLIEHFWDMEAGAFVLNRDDEIIQGALLTHGGQVVSEPIKERMA